MHRTKPGKQIITVQPDELKKAIDNIRMWQRGGERAPHKPLLLLYAFGRPIRGEPRLAAYEDIVDDLKVLLKEFGPYRQSVMPPCAATKRLLPFG